MKRISHLDVLGEVRRAQRILRRVEKYLHQQERAARRKLVKQPGRKYEEFMSTHEQPYQDEHGVWHNCNPAHFTQLRQGK